MQQKLFRVLASRLGCRQETLGGKIRTKGTSRVHRELRKDGFFLKPEELPKWETFELGFEGLIKF